MNIKLYTKGLFTSVPFTQYIMSSIEQKITKHTKTQKTQFEETEQAVEPGSDMAEMSELSEQEFKTTTR